MMEAKPFSYYIHWSTPIRGVNRKGHLCRILRYVDSSAQVEFEDGSTAIIDRRAARTAKATTKIFDGTHSG